MDNHVNHRLDHRSKVQNRPMAVSIVINVSLLLLFIAGLFVNLLQLVIFLFLKPVSVRWFRRINNYLTNAVFNHGIFVYEWWAGSRITMYYADDETERHFGKEHCLGLSNHTFNLDSMGHTSVMNHHDCCGSGKAFFKNANKFLPVIGWAFYFSESIFLARNWQSDVKKIGPALDKLVEYEKPTTLILAPEGTRFTQEKHRVSLEFAKTNNLRTFKHHLLPRTRGFVTTIRHLKAKYPNYGVYNIQIMINSSNDNFISMIKGLPADADYYVKRIPIEEIPTEDDEKLVEFLYTLFDEKDRLVEYHKNNKKFPGKRLVKDKKLSTLFIILGCQLFVVLPSLAYVLWRVFTSGNFTLITIVSTVISLVYAALSYMLRSIDTQSSYGT